MKSVHIIRCFLMIAGSVLHWIFSGDKFENNFFDNFNTAIEVKQNQSTIYYTKGELIAVKQHVEKVNMMRLPPRTYYNILKYRLNKTGKWKQRRKRGGKPKYILQSGCNFNNLIKIKSVPQHKHDVTFNMFTVNARSVLGKSINIQINIIIKKVPLGPVDMNYRPVSNLKYFAKVLECAALKQIVEHCENNKLLPKYQSAYRKGFSCETMLIKLADSILNNMESMKITAVIALDLSAASDTVNHSILLQTFQNYYELNGTVLNWLASYLHKRSCKVIVNGSISEQRELSLSVPQGGCGLAFYFIMYAATLFDKIPNHQDLFSFADDHTLSDYFNANSRVQEMNTLLELEDSLINIREWMNQVKLKMNPDKTEYILFGSKVQLKKCLTTSLNVCNDMIPIANKIRYLGSFLDKSLDFKGHIKTKYATAMSNFCKIHKI